MSHHTTKTPPKGRRILKRRLVLALLISTVALNIWWVSQLPTPEPMIGVMNAVIAVVLAID
jgi:hypothetical protein